MKPITTVITLFVYLNFLVTPLFAMSGKNTYVLAVSACPPWKTKLIEKDFSGIAGVCKRDVELFTKSIKEALNIPDENIFTLVNEKATYRGLEDGFTEFADTVPQDSRVFILINAHGELGEINSEDKPDRDEVLVLWTEEKPFTLLSALALKQWISASELRRMIDKVRVKEIIITVDACHAGASVPNIVRNQGRSQDWQGHEAVIMSSTGAELSYFTVNGSNGLFTLMLSDSIRNSPDLQKAFDKASEQTVDYIQDSENQKKCLEMKRRILNTYEPCVQTPITYDPSGILPTIKLNEPD